MSTEELTGRPVCKQRFKGIENFLRRVAFNLGNTPSQTEVKIISCIPIDVTDLQQKIIHLEKQLDEAKGHESVSLAESPKPANTPKRTSVNTALFNSTFPKPVSVAAISCKSMDCDQSTSPVCLQTKKKSNVSFIFPQERVYGPRSGSNENSNTSHSTEGKPTNKLECINDFNYNTTKMGDSRPTEHRRHFFKKKKKLLKKKARSPYVYYVQTNNSSPFNKSDLTEEIHNTDSDIMTRSYLYKMINKQYRPTVLRDNISQISQFSSPVCRDIQPHCDATGRYESDVCSCCHGPFHNIDSHVSKYNNPQTYMLNEINTCSAYYDTKHYDLVPVKEKPVKTKKDFEIQRKKEPKPHFDMKCWPETVRTKYRYQPLYPPQKTTRLPQNYQNLSPKNNYIIKERLDNYVKKKPVKVNRIEPIVKKVARRKKESSRIGRPVNIETSKSCSIDFGNVYPKKVYKRPKIQKSLQPIPIPRRNAECLTAALNNTECQTMNNIDENTNDAKTEATLNQIKSILQSVLAEVKVTSQTKSQVSEDKPKKDAIVQKGPSQNNMQASSLMNSITYSPYSLSPNPYITSCSRQLNSNQLYYPNSPLRCFQNFPLFIQTPGRHVCSSCYRNSSHVKSGNVKQAATIATNTDEVKEAHSTETEKLIKEIYKSMALTVEVPNKDTSLSEYEEMIKSMDVYRNPLIMKTEPKKQPKMMKNVVQAVSELFMKKDIIETSETPYTTIEEIKVPSNDVSTRSQLITTDTEVRLRKERLEKFLRAKNTQSSVAEAEKRAYHTGMIHNATTITESETSSSESESDTTLVLPKEVLEPKQKKEKTGLFSKMLKSVKLFKPKEKIKKKDEKSESEPESSSDSDDYQTIYSQKIEKSLKHTSRPNNLPKRKTHSKISYKQTYPRDRSPEKRRSPYMEQEYRRYWNERLMFNNDRPNHSSDQPYSEDTTPQKSAYYQTYEARSAFVEPNKPYIPKPEPRNYIVSREEDDIKMEPKLTSKGLAWLKKHKMGINCGEQWKKLILEG